MNHSVFVAHVRTQGWINKTVWWSKNMLRWAAQAETEEEASETPAPNVEKTRGASELAQKYDGKSNTSTHLSLRHTKFLPPATKLRQGNVFTHVCDSVHRGNRGPP